MILRVAPTPTSTPTPAPPTTTRHTPLPPPLILLPPMFLPTYRAQQRPAQRTHTGKQDIAQQPTRAGANETMCRLITLRLLVLWLMIVVMMVVAARGR